MDVKKSGSSSALSFIETKKEESEKQPEKAAAQGITSARDSFELTKTTRNSTAQEDSGKKQLGTAEEQAASNIKLKDPGEQSTSTSNDPQSRLNDAKNSGLVDRLGHEKTQSDSKVDQARKEFNTSDLKNSQTQTPEQSSSAVNDAQQKLNGGGRNDRQSLEQELAQRRQDFTGLGGVSPMDKLKSSTSPDPGAAPRGKSEVPTGKDAHADKTDDVINLAAGAAAVFGGSYGAVFGGALIATHALDNLTGGKLSASLDDNFDNKVDVFTDALQKKELQKNEDAHRAKHPVIVYHEGQSVEPDTDHPDGKKYEAADGTDVTPKTNPVKTPDSEHRDSNIPEDIKKSEQYFMDQIRKQKPKGGGETELTDGGVTGNSAVAGETVNNIFTRLGVQGLVGQPTRAGDDVGDPSNFSGGGTTINNGGATDPMEGSNYTGRTIEDDPADVKFGPAEQPKEQTGKTQNESKDSSTSIFDLLLNRKGK